MRELQSSSEGLTYEELLKRYNADVMINNRMKRLITNGQIKFRDGSYYINKPMMHIVTKIMMWLKRVVLGKDFDIISL